MNFTGDAGHMIVEAKQEIVVDIHQIHLHPDHLPYLQKHVVRHVNHGRAKDPLHRHLHHHPAVHQVHLIPCVVQDPSRNWMLL